MIKLETTKKTIREESYRILSIGYCELQYLLRYQDPFSYCHGYYGWSCDNYWIQTDLHELVISTGYSPIGCQNVKKPSYDIIRKYDNKAREIIYNNDYKIAKRKVTKLLYKFIDKELQYV